MTSATFFKTAGSILAVGLLSATLFAQSTAATRYDNQIQDTVTHKLAAKNQFGMCSRRWKTAL